MDWTDRRATLGLILTLSLGIGTLFFVTGTFVLASLFEFLGLTTLVLGWFVLAPAYFFLTRPTDVEAANDEFGSDDRDASARDPMEILQRRYAAGELSETEFERKLDRLLEVDARDTADSSVDRITDRLDRELESE